MSCEELARRLEEAKKKIQALQDELAETNREVMALTIDLEERVERRTTELREANRQLRQEIAERRRVEEALRTSERRYATIAKNLPNGVVHVIDRDLHYVFNAGEQLEKIGLSNEALVDRSIYDVLDPEEADWVAKQCERALAGEFVSFEGPFADRTFLVNAVPLRDSAGEIDEILALSIDITERKRAEEALQEYSEHLEEMVEERTRKLREAQEQLIRQEKLAVLGKLAGGVSHDLRNPLGAIRNAAYFLRLAVDEPDPQVQEALGILEREVDRSEGIIRGLLNFARAEPPTYCEVAINQLLRRTVSRVSIPERIDLIWRQREDLPTILADPRQLEQVFENLIRNAVQAMGDGGRLAVETRAASSDDVTVSISDTGIGIPEENKERVFEPLFTTKAKGIGLGLSIVKTLVEGHGGEVDVRSEVGKGTTFTVTLPVKGRKIDVLSG